MVKSNVDVGLTQRIDFFLIIIRKKKLENMKIILLFILKHIQSLA